MPFDSVISAVRKMVSGGTREVVLSGIDITSWGQDLPERPGGQLVLGILDNVLNYPPTLSSLDPLNLTIIDDSA